MRISDWSSDVCSSDLVLIDGRDEAAINLDPIKGQGTQMRKRAITGAEIVKRDAYALILQRPDDGLGKAQILEQGAFGNLYFQPVRSEEHTSELQSLMRISYAVSCVKKKKTIYDIHNN